MDNEEEIVNLFDDGDEQPIEGPEPVEAVTETPEFEVPEKFAGKSLEDVITSYTNLESEYGRKNNEVGELRKLTDDILRNQVAQGNPADEFTNESVEDDYSDYFESPSEAVEKAINENPRLKQLEDKIAADAYQQSRAELRALHSDADEVVASDGFSQWRSEAPSRVKRCQDAHNTNDVAAADDLISFYKQKSGSEREDAIAQRDATASAELKAASVETGSPNSESKPIYRRAELIRLKNADPDRYAKMSPSIMAAYADGRVK